MKIIKALISMVLSFSVLFSLLMGYNFYRKITHIFKAQKKFNDAEKIYNSFKEHLK